MAAAQYADLPAYSALLLRRTYPELAQPGGLIPRSKEWWSGKAKWSETDFTWTFPNGAVIAFGYLKGKDDHLRYQGAEFDFVGFDELTHFREEQYRYLFSRLRRRSDSEIPPRMRAATNPGGPGHRWVKRRFIDKLPDPDDPTDTPERCRERLFIPARLADNPGIDQAEYRESLQMLDPQTVEQLLNGDWNVREPGAWVFDHRAIDAAEELGRRFDELVAKGQMPPPAGGAMAAGIDYGDNATVLEPVWPLERGGLYVPPGEVHTSREDLEAIADQFLATMGSFPGWWGAARYDSSFAQSNRTVAAILDRKLGPHNAVKGIGRPNTVPVHFNKDKDPAIRYLRLLLNRSLDYVAGKGDGTRILAISPKARVLLDQMRGYKEDDFGKPQKGDDDAVDALIAGAAPVARKHRGTMDARTEKAKKARERKARKRVLPGQVA